MLGYKNNTTHIKMIQIAEAEKVILKVNARSEYGRQGPTIRGVYRTPVLKTSQPQN